MSVIDQSVIESIAHDEDDLAFIGKRFREYEAAYAAAKEHAEKRNSAEDAAFTAWQGADDKGADTYKANQAKIDKLTEALDKLTAENDSLWDAVKDEYVSQVTGEVGANGADVTTALRNAASNLRKVIDMATDGLPDGVTIPGRVGGKSGGTGQRQVGGMGKPWLSRIVLDGKDVEPSGEHPTLTDLSKLVNVSTLVLSNALYEANGQVRDIPADGTGQLHVTVNDTEHTVQLFPRERDTRKSE